MKKTQRETLIEDVKHGRLTPEQGEAKASQLGLPRLVDDPDPVNFDPMKEPDWTLPMAAAWIAFRTPDAVREWWDKFRSECLDWHFREWRLPGGPAYEGHFLEPRPAATLALFLQAGQSALRGDPHHGYSMSAEDAIDALWVALRQYCFEALGIERQTGERVTIPFLHWQIFERSEKQEHGVVPSRVPQLVGELEYAEVTVPMGAVRSLWPTSPQRKPKLRLALQI